MENNCLNCSRPITENFCSNCGQKKYKRIDRKYLIDEVQYLAVHTNKGFFYSLKNVARNPGKTAKKFIDGDRVNHYKPILLAFVLSGISAFLSFKVIKSDVIMENYMQQIYGQQKLTMPGMHDAMSLLSSYSSIIMLLLIPLASIVTALVFKKWGENYYEHVIMNTYTLIYYTILSIVVFFPILYLLKNTPAIFVTFMTLSTFIAYPFIMVWFYKEYYTQKSIGDIIIKVLLALAIGFVIYIMIIFGIAIWMVMNNPEMFIPKK
ncbi:DUF3667 domain-containing protein [Flavobacterium lindanitolerans]|uniref:Uncharacterized protein DUF3667 n=1 Tax=Flavobacterium lindanitolerans TaxID=428988 RepID=A0A497UVC6_9FLAO|nr:DUF3667 domain-containing protein [Flavobacterium lindanitolerans]PKW29787.1 uncharacterized protein DUF3667 [Flavobacterium lindanitolerans]RLJ34712.1 uncharacterized protein DUF3667 [Flavobacterium lindanitolerans]